MLAMLFETGAASPVRRDAVRASARPAARPIAPPAAIVIRPIRADDTARLTRFFRDLSPRSRHRRFHGVVNELPPAIIARFVDRNDADEMGLVAVLQRGGSETVIGETRYALTGSGRRAEFALTVADAAQGIGLGKRLLRALVRHAGANGITTMYGDVLPDNRPMLALTHALGFDERRDPNDARLRYVERRITSAG